MECDGGRVRGGGYIELPPLDVFACIFTRDDNDDFGDFALLHPFLELRHDLLDVRFDLIVEGGHHVEAIFLDPEPRLAPDR